MAKKKKTRQQKIIADLRRKIEPETPEISKETIKKQHSIPQTGGSSGAKINTSLYPYLAADLKRTGILTSAVVLAQIILYFLLTNNILNIPRLSY